MLAVEIKFSRAPAVFCWASERILREGKGKNGCDCGSSLIRLFFFFFLTSQEIRKTLVCEVQVEVKAITGCDPALKPTCVGERERGEYHVGWEAIYFSKI